MNFDYASAFGASAFTASGVSTFEASTFAAGFAAASPAGTSTFGLRGGKLIAWIAPFGHSDSHLRQDLHLAGSMYAKLFSWLQFPQERDPSDKLFSNVIGFDTDTHLHTLSGSMYAMASLASLVGNSSLILVHTHHHYAAVVLSFRTNFNDLTRTSFATSPTSCTFFFVHFRKAVSGFM